MAVYTEVDDDALAAFLETYDLGRLRTFKGIAEGVENSNYFVQTDAGSFILTLYEKRVAHGDLPFFLALLGHLAGKGLPVPEPVRGRDGASLRTLCGRPAALIEFMDGISVKRPRAEHCAALGVALAALHGAAADFPQARPNALSLPGWRSLSGALGARADTIAPGLAAGIDAELAALSADWPAGLPQGVIHADLFPDNVLFLGETVSGLIDFYFACTDALAYDIAVCLNAWCFEPDGAFNVTRSRALLRGYEAGRMLTPAERAALPVLCRGAALRFLLTRALDWLERDPNALVRPKDPAEYVRKLAFHRSARGPADYGLDP